MSRSELPQLPRVRKVLAYVVFSGRLLVFNQPDAPEAGLQVPAGTVEPGEDLADAVLRELVEESGLRDVSAPRLLGTRTVDMRPFGKAEFHERHFFTMRLLAPAPLRWRHWERHSSDGLGPIAYDLHWHALDAGLPQLAAGQGALLEALRSTESGD